MKKLLTVLVVLVWSAFTSLASTITIFPLGSTQLQQNGWNYFRWTNTEPRAVVVRLTHYQGMNHNILDQRTLASFDLHQGMQEISVDTRMLDTNGFYKVRVVGTSADGVSPAEESEFFQVIPASEPFTITTRKSAVDPMMRTVNAGAFVPMLAVDVKASGNQFHTSVYLIVQQKGLSSPFADKEALKGIYIGSPEKLVSEKSSPVDYAQTIIGPIHLSPDVWRTVIISGDINEDLTSVAGQFIGLDVVGITLNNYVTPITDDTRFLGTYPIRGNMFPIGTNKAEKLTIRNTTSEGWIPQGSGTPETLATFDFVAEGGDVKVSQLPFNLVLAEGDIHALKDIQLVNEQGEILAEDPFQFPFEKENGVGVYFRNSDIVIPEGTNHWTLKGIVSTNGLPETTTLNVTVEYFGEASGMKTSNYIIPVIENTSRAIQIGTLTTFTGSFVRYLTIGSMGADVRILQRVLNASVDTQVAFEGVGSPGNESLYFDEYTKAAVIKFQVKYGLPGTGFVGPLTTGRLNMLDLSQILVARIDKIVVNNLGGLSIMGSLKLNTSYDLEATTDFVTWESLGKIEGNAYGVLKEPIGIPMNVNPKFAEKVFFRLVEQP